MGFYNEPKYFLNNVHQLPDSLIEIIYNYIPLIVKVFLTKKNYLKYHYVIRNAIKKHSVENYIRATIRQDNNFVFKQLLVENYKKWLNMKKYYYRQCIYANYIYFLDSYSIENDSNKCRELIFLLLKDLGLSKNQHKKKAVNYIRWKI